jgi:hypothetical protein
MDTSCSGGKCCGKPFTVLAILLFLLIALAQFLRVVLGWQILLNGIVIPVWPSVVAVIVALFMALMLGRELCQ